MADIDVKGTVADIANDLPSNVDRASVKLATEYLRLAPSDFKRVVDQLVNYTNSSSALPHVYLESDWSKTNTTVRFDDSVLPFSDSKLLKYPAQPSSTSSLRYVDLMAAGNQVGRLEFNATLGLIRLSQQMPKPEAKKLMNSAEDAFTSMRDQLALKSSSAEYYPALSVRFRDLNNDGVDDELFDVRLTYGRASKYANLTRSIPLYTPSPTVYGEVKNAPPARKTDLSVEDLLKDLGSKSKQLINDSKKREPD